MSDIPTDYALTAYIDEAGEPGTDFSRRPSEFLVMAAAICPNWYPELPAEFFAHVRSLHKIQGDSVPKFQRCGAKLQFLLSSMMRLYPITIVTVTFHKPSLVHTYIGRNPGSMYSYLLKFTLERVSWFARDMQHPHDATNGRCNVRFSENTGLSYEAIQGYLDKLRQESGHNHSIRWQFLSIDDAKPEPHTNESCYHFADIAASATFSAFDIANRKHGETDDRFLRLLRPCICRDQKGMYGFKLFPLDAPIRDRPLMEFIETFK